MCVAVNMSIISPKQLLIAVWISSSVGNLERNYFDKKLFLQPSIGNTLTDRQVNKNTSLALKRQKDQHRFRISSGGRAKEEKTQLKPKFPSESFGNIKAEQMLSGI